MKVVINDCYGGFGLSHEGVMRYAELKGMRLYPWIDKISKEVYRGKATLDNPRILIHYTTVPENEYEKIATEENKKPVGTGRFSKSNSLYFSDRDIPRADPDLIRVIGELGDKASGRAAQLKVIEIPDNVEWEIEEYDGIEWIAEKHRTWR